MNRIRKGKIKTAIRAFLLFNKGVKFNAGAICSWIIENFPEDYYVNPNILAKLWLADQCYNNSPLRIVKREKNRTSYVYWIE